MCQYSETKRIPLDEQALASIVTNEWNQFFDAYIAFQVTPLLFTLLLTLPDLCPASNIVFPNSSSEPLLQDTIATTQRTSGIVAEHNPLYHQLAFSSPLSDRKRGRKELTRHNPPATPLTRTPVQCSNCHIPCVTNVSNP